MISTSFLVTNRFLLDKQNTIKVPFKSESLLDFSQVSPTHLAAKNIPVNLHHITQNHCGTGIFRKAIISKPRAYRKAGKNLEAKA